MVWLYAKVNLCLNLFRDMAFKFQIQYIGERLNMLLISFSVYEDGSCFDPSVLDITDDDILARFREVRKQDILHIMYFTVKAHFS